MVAALPPPPVLLPCQPAAPRSSRTLRPCCPLAAPIHLAPPHPHLPVVAVPRSSRTLRPWASTCARPTRCRTCWRSSSGALQEGRARQGLVGGWCKGWAGVGGWVRVGVAAGLALFAVATLTPTRPPPCAACFAPAATSTTLAATSSLVPRRWAARCRRTCSRATGECSLCEGCRRGRCLRCVTVAGAC